MQTNRASWSEDRAGTPLGRLLVSPTRPLAPQRAPGAVVGMPHALPPGIRFGTVPPGVAQSQHFSGAVVQRQPVSQITPQPDFVGPSYTAPMAVHPLVPLIAAALSSAGVPGNPPRPTTSPLSLTPKLTQAVNLPGGGTMRPQAVTVTPNPNANTVGPETFAPGPSLGQQTFTPQSDLAARLAVSKTRAYGF